MHRMFVPPLLPFLLPVRRYFRLNARNCHTARFPVRAGVVHRPSCAPCGADFGAGSIRNVPASLLKVKGRLVVAIRPFVCGQIGRGCPKLRRALTQAQPRDEPDSGNFVHGEWLAGWPGAQRGREIYFRKPELDSGRSCGTEPNSGKSCSRRTRSPLRRATGARN
jgi:hypothetical protein